MHSLLEHYLSEVAAHLSALPVKRRREELREMRGHLENAVIVNRELGQSEDEAARGAVAQFGTARDLGENVVWAWQRGEMRSRRDFFGAVVSTIVSVNLLPPLTMLLTCNFVVPMAEWLRETYHWSDIVINTLAGLVVPAPTWWLIGAISGWFFSKRAMAGTGCVLTAWIALAVAQTLRAEFVEIPDLMVHGYFHQRSEYRPFGDLIVQLIVDALLALIAMLSVRTVSRRRNAQTGRARLA